MAVEIAAIGFASSIAQLTGLNPMQLISMIWNSAQYAKVHKSNCIQFAENLQRIGKLLDPLKESKHLQEEALQQPLAKLKEQLFFGFILVDNCKNKSKLLVFAFSWYQKIPKKFQETESEIRAQILTCMPFINAHLQINHQNDMGQRMDRLHEEMKKIQEGKYRESRRKWEEEALSHVDTAIICEREHEKLEEGYKRERKRLDELLKERRKSKPAGQTAYRPGQRAQKAERADPRPDQNPLTESWHLYALKYSSEYRYRHSNYQRTSTGNFSHCHSLPPRAAPKQYFHSLSSNGTTSRSIHSAPPLPHSSSSESASDLSAESILSEVYCAVGYSYC